MQIQKLSPGNWRLLLSGEVHTLVNTSIPGLSEKSFYKLEPNNLKTEHPEKISLYLHPSGDYIYFFNEIPYKISGITKVSVFDFSEYEGTSFQILAAFDDAFMYLYTFKAPKNSEDVNADVEIPRFLGKIDRKLLWDDITEHLSFFHKNGYYYYDFHFCAFLSPYYIAFYKSILFRLTASTLDTFIVPKNSQINYKETGELESVVTKNGIFDLSSFTFFELDYIFDKFSRDDQYYYIFDLNTNKKMLFISEQELENFSHYSINGVEFAPLSTHGILVDLNSKEIVFSNGDSKCEFILYDKSMPHVIKQTNEAGESCFFIICYDEKINRFIKIPALTLPRVVSLWDGNSRKKSILFFQNQKASEDKEAFEDQANVMLALNESLAIECFDDTIQLHSVINFSSFDRYSSINDIEFFANPGISNLNFVSPLHAGIIVKTVKGEFGEFIYVPFAEKIQIDYKVSFFKYELLAYLPVTASDDITPQFCIEATCRKNDFENHTYLININ